MFAGCVRDEEEECVRGGRLGARVLRSVIAFDSEFYAVGVLRMWATIFEFLCIWLRGSMYVEL